MTVEGIIYELEAFDSEQELSIGYNSHGRLCLRVHRCGIESPVVHKIYMADQT